MAPFDFVREIFEAGWSEHYSLLHQNLSIYQIGLDLILLIFCLYVLFRKQYKPEKPLSKKEMEQLIQEWNPEPMHPPLSSLQKMGNRTVPTFSGSTGTHVIVDGKQVLNMARSNFLGMIGNKRVEKDAIKTLRKYGVGTCGPRGFYGTIDVHLNLEKRIKNFVGHDDAIIYSLGFATISSVISTFSGREDLLIVDKGVHFAIQTGVKLSRSEVKWFDHNDMDNLESILKEIKEEDRKGKRKLTRRWIITEGLFYNYGDILPLPKLMELKDKYCYRLIIDESYSIGILGKTGRGICEHFNVPPLSIDIITGNLASSTSSVGGFCLADKAIIYHQRLNASGYVYSASLPPLLTQSAITVFDILEENPKLISDLASNTEFFYKGISSISGLAVTSATRSPVVHLRLANGGDRAKDEEKLQLIVDEAMSSGILITRAQYTPESSFLPPPGIRICISASNTREQLSQVIQVIKDSAASVLSGDQSPKTRKPKDAELLADANKFLQRTETEVTPKNKQKSDKRKSTSSLE